MVMTGGHPPEVLRAAVAQMAKPHRTRTRLHLQTLDHKFLQDLSRLRVSDGAVSVQGDQAISRSISIQLVDRTDILGLAGASSGPTFLMQAWKGIFVGSLAEWVDLPVICAYVTKPTRVGDLLTIEGQDKGALGSFPTASMTLKKGRNVADAIRDVMHDRAGERRFRLAATSEKLPRDFVLDDQTTPLALAQAMGVEIGWNVFYDAEGYLVGAEPTQSPVFTFKSGPGGTLASGVSTGYWDGDIFNRVLVEGPVKSGKKITAQAVLPAAHELSPENLMRGGVLESGRRTYREPETIKTLTTLAKGEAWAERKLRRLALQQRTAAYDSAAVWHLQEHDPVRVLDRLDGVDVVAPWVQATIPMTCEGTQSNGYTRSTLAGFAKARLSSSRVRVKKKKR